MKTLHTTRLLLRPWEVSDAQALYTQVHNPIIGKRCGNKVFIKPENLQKTGSFKIRGAYNKISNLTDAEKKRGVIASSAGNHAQGVAYGAKKSSIKAVIVMPKSTPLIKVESTKQYGAEVILHGDVYDEIGRAHV